MAAKRMKTKLISGVGVLQSFTLTKCDSVAATCLYQLSRYKISEDHYSLKRTSCVSLNSVYMLFAPTYFRYGAYLAGLIDNCHNKSSQDHIFTDLTSQSKGYKRAIFTHQFGKSSNGKTTRASHKLQQPRPLFIVKRLQRLWKTKNDNGSAKHTI